MLHNVRIGRHRELLRIIVKATIDSGSYSRRAIG